MQKLLFCLLKCNLRILFFSKRVENLGFLRAPLENDRASTLSLLAPVLPACGRRQGQGLRAFRGEKPLQHQGVGTPAHPAASKPRRARKSEASFTLLTVPENTFFFSLGKIQVIITSKGSAFKLKKKKLYVRVFCHLAVREKLERKSDGEAGPRPGPAAALLGAAAAAAPAAAHASGCCASGYGLRRKGSGTAQGAPVHNPLLTAEDPPSSCTARGHCTNIARSAWPSYVLKSLKATSFQ